MRPPRIHLISAFPKLVLPSARLSLIFLLYEMSSLVGVIELSWGAGEDVQAVSGQCLQAALGMGCRTRPHASPKACPAGSDAAGGARPGVKGQSRAPCRNARVHPNTVHGRIPTRPESCTA